MEARNKDEEDYSPHKSVVTNAGYPQIGLNKTFGKSVKLWGKYFRAVRCEAPGVNPMNTWHVFTANSLTELYSKKCTCVQDEEAEKAKAAASKKGLSSTRSF